MEIQAVKAEAEQLRKKIQDAQIAEGQAIREDQRVEELQASHAIQLEKLTNELSEVKSEWESMQKLEKEIHQQELQAAVAAAEVRIREEEAARTEELVAQVRVPFFSTVLGFYNLVLSLLHHTARAAVVCQISLQDFGCRLLSCTRNKWSKATVRLLCT
jgi:SMC interacting uncharacterized protein involved in chromosome segregation